MRNNPKSYNFEDLSAKVIKKVKIFCLFVIFSCHCIKQIGEDGDYYGIIAIFAPRINIAY